MNYKIIIDGFKTEAEAIAWCNWYEGGGEQTVEDIGENISGVLTDMNKLIANGGFKADKNNEIYLPVEIYYEEKEEE